MIPDTEVGSKINSVKIYKMDPYFYQQYEKYIEIDDNERKYISFKIEIYFSECSLAVEIDKKGLDRDIIFESIRKKAKL